MRIDLHIHTTASDGQYTPAEVIRLAQKRNLQVIAITDHDTTDGITPAQQAAQADGGMPLIVPGIELSAEDEVGDVHMLGYFLNIEHPPFQTALNAFRERRFFRAQKIVQLLADMGMPVAWERVEAIANGGAIGRPHIARALVEAGHVNSIGEAFEKYIYNGGPAYVARKRLTPEESVALIHSAGGVAVMAHPGLVDAYEPLIAERLVPAGLDGVEVVHPKNPEPVRLNLRGLARRFDLIMTGGSDFHRPNEDGSLNLGTVNPPEGCLNALRERAKRYALSPAD